MSKNVKKIVFQIKHTKILYRSEIINFTYNYILENDLVVDTLTNGNFTSYTQILPEYYLVTVEFFAREKTHDEKLGDQIKHLISTL